MIGDSGELLDLKAHPVDLMDRGEDVLEGEGAFGEGELRF